MYEMEICFPGFRMEANGNYWIRNITLNNTRRMETALEGR
jgi:hypothetical protein